MIKVWINYFLSYSVSVYKNLSTNSRENNPLSRQKVTKFSKLIKVILSYKVSE